MSLIRWILDFLHFDDDAIRFFVYGGAGSIVTGVSDDKKKTFWHFLGLAFVGASTSAFFTPSVIEYYHIENLKYQMTLGFTMGIISMILVGKLIRWVKSMRIKTPFKIEAEEGEENG